VGLINPALTHLGRSDLAYQLLFTDTYPSWLYTIRQGATTMWERWDGYTPENGFQASSMNSFNHYSFGSVGLWLYSGAAGIQVDPAKPGYQHFMLAPQLTSRMTYVKATMDTPYGVISSYWHKEGGQYLYDVIVPPNTTATLTLPVVPAGYPKVGVDSVALVAGKYEFAVPGDQVK
jgi:alpha-L-rhamnosidase